jgi:hypothetical protein
LKIAILVLCLGALSAALLAKDLRSASERERSRREAIASRGKSARSFDDDDLARYRSGEAPRVSARESPRVPSLGPPRNLEKERARWRSEAEAHRRELERIDAGIRRLEWRLAERQSRRRPGERLARDASERLLEESLESLKEERRRLEEHFRERARKAGAFPGWLR